MKQSKQIQRICAAVIMVAVVMGMLSISAFAVSGGLDLNGVLTAVVSANGDKAAVVDGALEVEALKGDFFGGGELSRFTTLTGTNMVGGDADANFIRAWDFRASAGTDSVIKITVKQDMRLEISEGNDLAPYDWGHNGAFYYVTENAAGTRVTVKTIHTSQTMSYTDFGMQIHAAAGDKIYVIYKTFNTEGYTQAMFHPWFQVETAAYDAAQRPVYDDEIKQQGIAFWDMVSGQVAAGGAPVTDLKFVDYQFLTGSYDGGTLAPFTVINGAGDTNPDNDILGDPDGNCAAWRWQWRASVGTDIALKLTASKDVYVKIHQDGGFDSWASGSYIRYIVANGEGKTYEVKKYQIDGTKTSAESILGEIHLAQGDSLYVVYTDEQHNPATASFCPTVFTDSQAYNANTRNEYYEDNNPTPPPAPSDKTDYLEHPYMVSQAVKANGGVVDSTLVEYQYLHGSVAAGKLNPFTTLTGAGTASEDDDALGDANSDYAIWRWQWRCGGGDTVLKMTAKENLKLDLTAWAVNEQQWAKGTSYKFYLVNEDGGLEILKEVEVKETVDVADYAMTVHMAKGDTLYIIYSNSYGEYADGSPATSHYMPVFTMSTNGYDEAQRPAFDDQLPKTGDESMLLCAAVLMIVSACACAVVLKKKEQF